MNNTTDELLLVASRTFLGLINIKNEFFASIPSKGFLVISGVTVLEGPLYAVGGHDGWSYLSTVERWDADLRQWSYVAPMAFARSTAGIAILNNKYDLS